MFWILIVLSWYCNCLIETFICFTCCQVSCKLLFPITSSYSSLYTTWKIIALMKEKSVVTKWLSSVKSLLPASTQVPAHVFLLLAYLLIQENGDSLRDVLQATTEIAKADCSQVKTFFSDLVFFFRRWVGFYRLRGVRLPQLHDPSGKTAFPVGTVWIPPATVHRWSVC